jgi:hypothetical protein
MRKALVVGVDYYQHISGLFGCVNDAHSVKSMLGRHSDGSVNFSVKHLTGKGHSDQVIRSEIKDAVIDLFADDAECALFYFGGHGHIEAAGGYILTSECARGDEGLSLNEIMILANGSKARNKVIVLDSCHSGLLGNPHQPHGVAELSEGVTILTASAAEQYANEESGSGVFTNLFVDALGGSAANLVGEVTPGSVYAHIDQSLGPWDQRPVFKTNVKSFVSLRRVQAPIPLSELQRLREFFPSAGSEFRLDPSFEPEGPCPDATNTARFALLQRLNRVNLVVPVDAPHMYHAAMGSKACRLTVLGEHYRRLVAKGMI